jgi:hypothetical protein
LVVSVDDHGLSTVTGNDIIVINVVVAVDIDVVVVICVGFCVSRMVGPGVCAEVLTSTSCGGFGQYCVRWDSIVCAKAENVIFFFFFLLKSSLLSALLTGVSGVFCVSMVKRVIFVLHPSCLDKLIYGIATLNMHRLF